MNNPDDDLALLRNAESNACSKHLPFYASCTISNVSSVVTQGQSELRFAFCHLAEYSQYLYYCEGLFITSNSHLKLFILPTMIH